MDRWIIITILLCCLLMTGCFRQPDMNSDVLLEYDSLIESNDRIAVAGIYKDGSRAWFIEEGLSAEERAKELGADDFIYIDAKMDNDIYIKALQSVVDEGVNGVIISIPDAELSEMTLEILTENNIPFVATNDPIINDNGELLAPFIGVDDYTLGDMTGDWMANYAIKNGLLDDSSVGIMILENNEISNMLIRSEGQRNRFLELIPNRYDESIITRSYNGETEDAFEVAMDEFSKNTDKTSWLVMTGNDEGAIGVVRSMEQLGIDQNSAVVGIGGALAMDEFQREYSALKASAYYSPEKIGAKSAEQIMAMIEEKEDDVTGTGSLASEPSEVLFNAVIVTKENYQEVTGNE